MKISSWDLYAWLVVEPNGNNDRGNRNTFISPMIVTIRDKTNGNLVLSTSGCWGSLHSVLSAYDSFLVAHSFLSFRLLVQS